ncbi:MAG: AGE family epimerase/isomerase [Actinomycetes bacterium]
MCAQPAPPTIDDTQRAALRREADRLLDQAPRACGDDRFWWVDDDLRPDPDHGQQLWITARLTHVFSLGHLLGRSGAGALADVGLASIDRDFGDREHGGWFPQFDRDGTPVPTKAAYEHAFVMLAAASATVAGRPGAADLLDRATRVVVQRFWDDDAGALVESWDRPWRELEDYRGANANMHAVEAFLAVADATGDPVWRERARRITERVIDGAARQNDWRVPEHFDRDWRFLPDYNRDQPRHPFRPFGATPGHGLEWARLLLQLHSQLPDGTSWMPDAAVALFDRAIADGWDGAGLVYTTDWAGAPVVRERFHWVTCEGMATAAALSATTGDARYAEWFGRLWDHAQAVFIDRDRGGWRHEVDVDNRPSSKTWQGKPDWYHAVQAALFPLLHLSGSFAEALRSTG